MKIGISITSAHQVVDVREGAKRMIDRARAANQAGLDSLFVGDHHITSTPYYQNTPIMGRLLAEWDKRPSGALYLLPLWNPVLAAEQIATLACIAEGPFIMQCGLGRDDYQFNGMGANIRYRPSALEQALQTLRDLWNGDKVTLDGRWRFQGASISPLPPESIEVWIGASAKVAIDRAARLADAWLADPSMNLEQAKNAIEHYKSCLDTYGKSADTIAIRRDIYVATSSDDATRTREAIEQKGYRGFSTDSLIIGDIGSVAEQFSAYEEIGYTDIIVRNLHPDPVRAVESIERLGEVRNQLI